MRVMGVILLIVGLLGLVTSFTIDTSVPTGEAGKRVHNIGLLNDKQNLLLLFAVITLVGAIFAARRPRSTGGTVSSLRKCPYCAEDIKAEAKVCRHCGRELDQALDGLDPETATLLKALRAAGYQVGSVGGGKWRIAHSTGLVVYPASAEELRRLAAEELAKVNRPAGAA